MDPFVRLRERLTQPPSRQTFQQIFALFDSWPEETRAAGLEYAQAHMTSWPDHSRAVGEELFYELPDGALSTRIKPQALLVREFAFAPSEANTEAMFLKAIAMSPACHHLTSLRIMDLDDDQDANDDAIAALASSPHLTKLTTLGLGGPFGYEGWIALAQAPHLRELPNFACSGCLWDNESAALLAESYHITDVIEYITDTDYLDEEGLMALATSPYLPPEIRRTFLNSASTEA